MPKELRRTTVPPPVREWVQREAGASVVKAKRLAGASSTSIHGLTLSDGTRLVLAMAAAVMVVRQAGPDGKAAAFREAKDQLKSAADSCAARDVPAGAARAYRRVVSCISGEAGTLGARLWALWQRVAPWVK